MLIRHRGQNATNLQTEAAFMTAVQNVADGASVRSTAKKYQKYTFMLRQR